MKLLFPLLGILTTAAAVGGGLYKAGLFDQISSTSDSSYEKINLLVDVFVDSKVQKTSTDSSYYCEWNKEKDNVKDSDCKLIEIKFDETTKSIDSKKLQENTSTINNFSSLIPNENRQKPQTKHYILQTNKKHENDLKKINFSKIGKISSSSSKESSLPFYVRGMFDKDWNFQGSSTFVVGKLESIDTTEQKVNLPFICDFKEHQNINEYKRCHIFETDKSTEIEKMTFKAIDERGTNSISTTDAVGKLYLISLDHDMGVNKENLKDKSKKITFLNPESTTNDEVQNAKKITFSIEALVIGNLLEKPEVVIVK